MEAFELKGSNQKVSTVHNILSYLTSLAAIKFFDLYHENETSHCILQVWQSESAIEKLRSKGHEQYAEPAT